jgi:hypothetical protein
MGSKPNVLIVARDCIPNRTNTSCWNKESVKQLNCGIILKQKRNGKQTYQILYTAILPAVSSGRSVAYSQVIATSLKNTRI